MVAVLLGADVRSLLGEGLLSAADQILVPLANAPAAMAPSSPRCPSSVSPAPSSCLS
jgi:hypothetical protein